MNQSIIQKAEELQYSMDALNKELKRVASIKCRLNKQKGKPNYQADYSTIVYQENILKEVRALLTSKPKAVPQYTQEDVDKLNYDETVRAIKSIQSKKSLSRWLTPVEGDNDEYRHACVVEQMLREHKDKLQPPTTSGGVSRSAIEDILHLSDILTKEEILEKLQSLL